MLICKLEFIPIVEVKVFVSLSYFISKFPLYFATTLLILLVPIPCIPDVFLDDTRVKEVVINNNVTGIDCDKLFLDKKTTYRVGE